MQHENEQQLQWPARIFFTAVALGVICAIFYFFLGARDVVFYWNPETAGGPADYRDVKAGDRVVLPKDRDVLIGRMKLVYRGATDGMLNIEATVLDLDSDYAYSHRFSPAEAKASVNLGGRTFRLVSWNRARVSLDLMQ